jgi:hypothetical protein
MKELRGHGATNGGNFKTNGSTLEVQDEWTAVMPEQELEIESPILR